MIKGENIVVRVGGGFVTLEEFFAKYVKHRPDKLDKFLHNSKLLEYSLETQKISYEDGRVQQHIAQAPEQFDQAYSKMPPTKSLAPSPRGSAVPSPRGSAVPSRHTEINFTKT